ncbi:hypothetical protein Clacol_000911 [Clathrus columnatus]|uniref:Uncharacterized protein n=1 Tax=Clathrus columnatus TaxID=1419009 RepID=A0AAV5A499_9AGAM|nr:hypothetical protein Clacol_000911 [Clathrus columnatus]
MFSEDDLDSILFGQPGDLSADEFKYFDTPGIGISDAALPFHDESSLLFGNDQVASSSNCNVDLLGVDASHSDGLTLHVDIIDRGTSSNTNTGSTPQNAPQLSTLPYDSSLKDTAGFNIPTVQPFTTSSLQNENASLEGPTGPPRERQRSPSSSAPLGSCSTAQSNASTNLDWNSIYLSLGLTSSHTFDPANDPSYSSVSSNTQTAVELPPTNDAFDAIQFPGFVDNNDASYTQSAASPTNNDVFDAVEPLYFNNNSTPCIDNTQSAELQPNNYVFDLTGPEYFPSPSPPKQISPLLKIEQQTPINAPQPPAVAHQCFTAPSTNPTPFPSYTQPTNSTAYPAIQPESHPLKPSSSPGNTRQLVFPNVPPPQATPTANAPHQYYPMPTPNENTPIPSQLRANQASVNNLNPAFFSTPPQHGFNPDVQSHIPHQPSAAPLPPNGRQHIPGSIPTPQAQGLSVNMPLNRQQMLPGPGNVAQNPVNFPMTADYGVPNSQQQHVTPSNKDSRPRQTHNNPTRLDDSSVANNQRLNTAPNTISTTGYNANGIVPNPHVPPTLGVSNVEPVNQQLFHPTPPAHAAVAQGGPHHPPSNNSCPHPIPPPFPTILDTTHSLPTRQPLIHPWTQQPVYIMPPSVPKSRSTSSTPIPSSFTSDLVITRPRKKRQRPQDDGESAVKNTQKRSRVDRPAEYLYEEVKKGKYTCRYAGPAQPGGCKAPTFTSMSSLSTHIMLIHAKSETEMNLPVEQRTAYNGLPPSLRSVHVVCPLPDAELARCKHFHEHGRRWEAHVMDTAEHAVHSHIASNHV